MLRKAMILAAGRGERLRPLTDHTPKPLIRMGAYTLIEHHLLKLANSGIHEVVINLAYRGTDIEDALSSGERYGVSIQYTHEPEGALGTGGGVFAALPLLGTEPFILISADIFTDFPFNTLPAPTGLAHLVVVDNPAYHPEGDFGLTTAGLLTDTPRDYTYGNIGVLHPQLFHGCTQTQFELGPLLRHAIQQQQVTGEYYHGAWFNVGTAEELAEARQHIPIQN
ncbi:MAG: mannose-1-phosphate guanylyltransferase [Gammaproteobacteria bacterium RIFCSPHIGHO2_12_FULL_45_9]|nr:MAG: mannose-1-phosphate guanylyltransferase [Gammaproteobacteria bacterium RIFCSPHIGHO2_12_FULL_45_9]